MDSNLDSDRTATGQRVDSEWTHLKNVRTLRMIRITAKIFYQTLKDEKPYTNS